MFKNKSIHIFQVRSNSNGSLNSTNSSHSDTCSTISNSSDEMTEDDYLKCKSLDDMKKCKEFYEVISAHPIRSPCEILLMSAKFILYAGLNHEQTSKYFEYTNKLFSHQIIPDSKHLIDELLNDKSNAEFHAICPLCTTYLGEFEKINEINEFNCPKCLQLVDVSNRSSPSYFVTLDPSRHVAKLLETYEDHYDYIIHDRVGNANTLRDIYDGKKYRKFRESLPDLDKLLYATATFNTDGFPIFESSNYSVWPVYFMINELPIQNRFNNLVTCGLWVGKGTKPEMSVFINKFVEKMNYLSTVGVECTIKGKERKIKLYNIIGCMDSTARPTTTGKMQFNAKDGGCDWCLSEGHWFAGATRYPMSYPLPELRTQDNHLKNVGEAIHTEEAVHGVKYASSFMNLNEFDLFDGIVPDYMHCYCLGVGKQFTNLLLRKLDKDKYTKLNNYMLKIKPPRIVSHMPRLLSEISKWKAREFENWILYYSIPLFSLVLTKKQVKHWSLLVRSLHILLSRIISKEELKEADTMLTEFACDAQLYYSESVMTYNVHILLHMCKSVEDWGPVWAHSCYPFESENAKTGNAIKNANGILLQIIRNINLCYSICNLEQSVYPFSSAQVKKYCESFGRKKLKNFNQTNNITYLGKGKLNSFLNKKLGTSKNARCYDRITKDHCLYKSSLKENKRSCNSYAQLENGSFIKIIKFMIDEEKEITVCKFLVIKKFPLSDTHFLVEKESSELSLVKTEEIKKVCVFIQIEKASYICTTPNLLHY